MGSVVYPRTSGRFGVVTRDYTPQDYTIIHSVRPTSPGAGEVIRDQDVAGKVHGGGGLIVGSPTFWRAPDETCWSAMIMKKSTEGIDLFPLAVDGFKHSELTLPESLWRVSVPSYATYYLYARNLGSHIEFSDGSIETVAGGVSGEVQVRVIGPYSNGKYPVYLSGVDAVSWHYDTLPPDAANHRLQSGGFLDQFLPAGVI